MQKKTSCELLTVGRLVGSKWGLPILFEFERGDITFNDLKERTKNKMNSTLLSNYLKGLVAHGVIIIKDEEKKFYCLSKSGKELLSIAKKLKTWSEKNGLDVGEDCINRSCMECGKFI